MPEYEWVFKKEYQPVKAELENVIRKVVKIMRDEYDTPGIEYQLIGSGNRHLITRIKGGNKGFDLDYNLILPTLEEGYKYKQKVIADQFMEAFREACHGTSYKFPSHTTSVIQLNKVDQKNSRICYGGDFAIIYYDLDEDAGYWYLKHWDDGHYTFEKRKQSQNIDWKLDEIMEYNDEQGWNWIRDEYLKLKNRNGDPNKHSYVLYLEAVHNVYNQIQQAMENEEDEF